MKAQRLVVTLLAPLALSVMTLPQPARAQDQAGAAATAGGGREPGGDVMVSVVTTATVKSIDPEKRLVTLQTADGDLRVIKVEKEAVNFDQVKVGDQVKAMAMQRVIVSLPKGDGAGATGASEGQTITRAPKGAKPGMIISNTEQVTVRIDDVDAQNRKVTLEGADGQKMNVEVAPDVDVSRLKPGDNVTVQVTRGLALWVEKPDAAQPAAAQMKPGDAAEAMGGMSATFTVSDIDKEKRIVTLKPADGGEPRQVQLGKDAINFDQIAVGDKVTTTMVEEVAIAISKGGTPPPASEGMFVARAPRGSKPRVLISESEQVTGKIDSVDAAKRTVTVTGKDGKPDTFKVGPKVDLSDLKAGDDVSARVTSALAIVVEKA